MSRALRERENELKDLLLGLKADIADLQIEKKAVTEASRLAGEISDLREELEVLRIEKDRKAEEFDRRERELKHMIGLEKKRQEVEIEQSKREATIIVREENLSADRERFAEQMKFTHERFAKETKYLQELMSSILERLPSVTVEKSIDLTFPPNGQKEAVGDGDRR